MLNLRNVSEVLNVEELVRLWNVSESKLWNVPEFILTRLRNVSESGWWINNLLNVREVVFNPTQ